MKYSFNTAPTCINTKSNKFCTYFTGKTTEKWHTWKASQRRTSSIHEQPDKSPGLSN